MRKIILYSAVSADGFIAKKDGDIEWLHDPSLVIDGEDYGYSKLMESIDTTLMGSNTYRQILGFDMPFPYQNKKNYVFSSDTKLDSTYADIIGQDQVKFIENLKSQKGKDIWLVGGGKLNASLLSQTLIDELILSVIPIILGEGIRLFEGVLEPTALNLKKCLYFDSGMIQQWYTLKKE